MNSTIPDSTTAKKSNPPFSLLARAGNFIDRLSVFAGQISGVMMVFAALIVLFEIIMRSVFNIATNWEFEVVIYLMIWFVCLSLPFAQKEKAHIDLDILLANISPKLRETLTVGIYFLSMVFSVLFSYYSFQLFQFSFTVGEKGPYSLNIPFWPVKIAFFIGTLLLSLQILRMLISQCYLVYRNSRENAQEVRKNILLTLPVFAAALAVSLYLINVSPLIGIVVLIFVLLFGGVPVGFCLGLGGAAGLYFVFGGERAMVAVATSAFSQLNSFTLIALPLFIFAGQVMQSGKLAAQFFKSAALFLGHLPGGLGIATMAACALFAAINGSSAATAATIGLVAIPELISRGYSKSLSCGIVAAGGTLGILIPPSNSMILIGAITGESVGKLFMAGLIPGVLLALMFAVCIPFLVRKEKYQRMPKASWKERGRALKESIWALLIPVVVLGGIYTGIFTVTEAAAVAVIYAVVFGLISRTVKVGDVNKILGESTTNTGMVFMIVIGALILGLLVTKMHVTQDLVEAVLATNMPGWLFVVVMMLILVVLGMFLEGVSITLIVIPLMILPLQAFGFSMIWFAVLFTINMELAMITPPVAINIYIVQKISGASHSQVLRGVWVFAIVMFIAMAIVGLVPLLSLWIPSKM